MLEYIKTARVWTIQNNIWHGVTVNRQKDVKERGRPLLMIPGPKWLCVEPILEPIDLRYISSGIDWVVIGGETGPGARKPEQKWIDDVMMLCRALGIPVWTKAGTTWHSRQAPERIADILKTDKRIVADCEKVGREIEGL